MRIVVPVEERNGLASRVSDELGHAPFYAVVEGESIEFKSNEEVMRGEGPRWVRLLESLRPDVVITREIGRPALSAFRARGIRVLYADGATLGELLDRYRRGELRDFPEELAHEPHHAHH